jgi:hypothetical protein
LSLSLFFRAKLLQSHLFGWIGMLRLWFSGVSENSLGDRHGSSAGCRRGASLPSVSSAIFLDDLALFCRSEKSTYQQQLLPFNVCCMHQLSRIMLIKRVFKVEMRGLAAQLLLLFSTAILYQYAECLRTAQFSLTRNDRIIKWIIANMFSLRFKNQASHNLVVQPLFV